MASMPCVQKHNLKEEVTEFNFQRLISPSFLLQIKSLKSCENKNTKCFIINVNVFCCFMFCLRVEGVSAPSCGHTL